MVQRLIREQMLNPLIDLSRTVRHALNRAPKVLQSAENDQEDLMRLGAERKEPLHQGSI